MRVESRLVDGGEGCEVFRIGDDCWLVNYCYTLIGLIGFEQLKLGNRAIGRLLGSCRGS